MPQVLEYYAIEGKRWEWHLVLFKEWLRQVESGTTHRKYVKWLRTRKVFDRGFIEFVELFLGINHPRKKPPRLNEVGEELVGEMKSSDQQARGQLEAMQPAEPLPEPEMPGGPVRRIRRRRSDEQIEAEQPETKYVPPSAESDAFLRAMLDRFTELNPYMTMFVLKEIGDDFLGANELFRRIGTNDYDGNRPSMPHFQTFLTWLEWLGGVKKIGFRYKLTDVGTEISLFLKELPLDELIEDEEDEDEDEDEVAEEAEPEPAPKKAKQVEAPAPTDEPDDEDEDDDDDEYGEPHDHVEDFEDDELDEEGLDLPPEAAAQEGAEAFWKKEETPAISPLAELTKTTAAMREEPAPPAPEPPAPVAEAPPEPKPEPAPPKPVDKTPEPAPKARVAPPAAPTARVVDNGNLPREALHLAVSWWLDGADSDPSHSITINLRPHPSGRQVGIFKLLALGSLLEAAVPTQQAIDLYLALDGGGALEAMIADDAPLDGVLETSWSQQADPALEERLVHLARYRRGLNSLDPSVLKLEDARAMAITLREKVTGSTLGPGLIFVLRELTAAGLGPSKGLEAVSWLPSLLTV